MSKVVLISHHPLPFSHIGSWTTMYRNYLESQNEIDIIICTKPDGFFEDIQYQLVEEDFLSKLRKQVKRNDHYSYIKALKKVIKPDEKYILQIVDNFGLAKEVQKYIKKENLRKNCYLQFFYHGYPPMGGYSDKFYALTDEIVVLTHSAYEAFRSQSNALSSRFSVLHNGIDTRKFFPVSVDEQQDIKRKLGFEGKKVFVWCSQDHPKKGLHIVLDAWKTIHQNYPEAMLLVIGCKPKEPQAGVHYGGRIPNDLLPQYYQMAEVYLFSTLCQEGFGMSLIEAMHCGCYCIASAMGGVPEVLQFGKLGKLIQKPHFVNEWIDAVSEYLKGNAESYSMPKELYTSQRWSEGMTKITQQAKYNFD